MAKKSGIEVSTRKITDIAGKGPYMPHETMQGSKCMSGKRTGLTGSGKMSSAHGTTGQSKNNNMDRNTGGYRIGAGCPTFKHEGYRTAGYSGGGTKHASQPSGHKSKA